MPHFSHGTNTMGIQKRSGTPRSGLWNIISFHERDTGGAATSTHDGRVSSGCDRFHQRRFRVVSWGQPSGFNLGALLRIVFPVVVRAIHRSVRIYQIERRILQRTGHATIEPPMDANGR
jgi:hypothetical protein